MILQLSVIVVLLASLARDSEAAGGDTSRLQVHVSVNLSLVVPFLLSLVGIFIYYLFQESQNSRTGFYMADPFSEAEASFEQELATKIYENLIVYICKCCSNHFCTFFVMIKIWQISSVIHC